MGEFNGVKLTGYGHPYILLDGDVTQYKNAVSFDTEEFLKFVVDALNEKAERES